MLHCISYYAVCNAMLCCAMQYVMQCVMQCVNKYYKQTNKQTFILHIEYFTYFYM